MWNYTRVCHIDYKLMLWYNEFNKETYFIIRQNSKHFKLADGTIISYRQVSKSDGTSVVEINIRYSTNAGGLKYQKIHFTEGDK